MHAAEMSAARVAFERMIRAETTLWTADRLDRVASGYVLLSVEGRWRDFQAGWGAGATACAESIKAKADATVSNWQHGTEDMVEDSKARAWDYLQCAVACRALAAP